MIEINKEYTRKTPSPRYLEIVEEYKKQHVVDIKPGLPHYNGSSLLQHVDSIKDVLSSMLNPRLLAKSPGQCAHLSAQASSHFTV